MNPEALILRRCYPVPVTFADLRAVYVTEQERAHPANRPSYPSHRVWSSRLKEATGAIDEVYAVVDGREVRVAVVKSTDIFSVDLDLIRSFQVGDLLIKAERDGYWERPHEVRFDLLERPVSHGEVARAVVVGQEALERGVVRS